MEYYPKSVICSMFHVPCSIKQKGFTIIEMIVVLSIFLIVIGVLAGIFLSMVQHQKRMLQQQEILNQASYAMEYMSKAIRTAEKDTVVGGFLGQGNMYVLTHCDNGVTEACSGIKFINSSDSSRQTEFYFENNALKVSDWGQDPVTISPFMSGGVKYTINNANFIINGDKTARTASDADAIQPRVTIVLAATSNIPGSQQQKIIQTTVSARNLNIP
nr:hypothetical protein [uncultured archaeon]